jgi:hypothetical protein
VNDTNTGPGSSAAGPVGPEAEGRPAAGQPGSPESDVRAAARGYIDRGFAPVPVHPRSAKPVGDDWQNLRLTADDLAGHFPDDPRRNLGLLTGAPSGGLIDIDLDCPEARTVAPWYLPPTEMVHGRPGAPLSHWWYKVGNPPPATQQFQDTQAKEGQRGMLVEFRGTGGQTVVPPSVHHKAGEPIAWAREGEPALVDAADLLTRVRTLAAAALVARYWPAEGSRQAAALALQGGLARARWDLDRIQDFILAVCEAAGDEECDKRAETAALTIAKVQADQETTGWPTLAGLLGDNAVDRVRELLGSRELKGQFNGTPGATGSPANTVKALVTLAERTVAELFHDDQHEPYAVVRDGDAGPQRILRIESAEFIRWLTGLALERLDSVPSRQALEDVARTLGAKADFRGPERRVFLRVAGHEGKTYLDLGDSGDCRAVEIDADGWRVVGRPPVVFYRPAGLLALPEPQRVSPAEGQQALARLRDILGVGNVLGWKMAVGWLLAAVMPRGPYPVSFVYGPQGAAKTSASRALRSMIDPHEPSTRELPRDGRDLASAARNSYTLSFDNVSHVAPWLSDALCSVATGIGLASRKLYTNADEFRTSVNRPQMMNGITLDCIEKPDLLDRIWGTEVAEIADTARRTQAEVDADLDAIRPRVLGALLAAAAAGLRNLPAVRPARLPRMADASKWVEACAPALGWREGEFLDAYFATRGELDEEALERWPVWPPLTKLLDKEGAVEDTVAGLLVRLDEVQLTLTLARPTDWPRSARKLSAELKRYAPLLRRRGVVVSKSEHTNKGNVLRIAAVARPGGEEAGAEAPRPAA